MQNRRATKTWMDLFNSGDASCYLPPLENENRETFSNEIGGHSQPIVPGTDDDDLLAFGRHQFFQLARIFFAAFSPGAPMIPPPGCVAEPHM